MNARRRSEATPSPRSRRILRLPPREPERAVLPRVLQASLATFLERISSDETRVGLPATYSASSRASCGVGSAAMKPDFWRNRSRWGASLLQGPARPRRSRRGGLPRGLSRMDDRDCRMQNFRNARVGLGARARPRFPPSREAAAPKPANRESLPRLGSSLLGGPRLASSARTRPRGNRGFRFRARDARARQRLDAKPGPGRDLVPLRRGAR